MTEWLMDIHNQFLLTVMGLVGLISFLAGHKIGEREGYEDGVRTLAKTMKLNQVRLKLDFEEEEKC
jgi:hypothetical protein